MTGALIVMLADRYESNAYGAKYKALDNNTSAIIPS